MFNCYLTKSSSVKPPALDRNDGWVDEGRTDGWWTGTSRNLRGAFNVWSEFPWGPAEQPSHWRMRVSILIFLRRQLHLRLTAEASSPVHSPLSWCRKTGILIITGHLSRESWDLHSLFVYFSWLSNNRAASTSRPAYSLYNAEQNWTVAAVVKSAWSSSPGSPRWLQQPFHLQGEGGPSFTKAPKLSKCCYLNINTLCIKTCWLRAGLINIMIYNILSLDWVRP